MNTTVLLVLHGLAVGLVASAIMALFWYAILPRLPLQDLLDRCNKVLPYSGCFLAFLYLIGFIMGGVIIVIVAFVVVETVAQVAGVVIPPSDDARFLSMGMFVGSLIGSVLFSLLRPVVREYRKRTGKDHSSS